MRRSFILLLPCAALLLALSGACGGNVVLDGQGGSGGAPTTTTSNGTTTTTSTVTSTTGTGAGAAPGTGSGGATSCISCASRFMEFESGVSSPDPVCAGASQDAFNVLLSCACSSFCASACAVNVCISQAITMPCVDCLAQSCAGASSVCNSN